VLFVCNSSVATVADQRSGGAFLTPGSWMGKNDDPTSIGNIGLGRSFLQFFVNVPSQIFKR
jgi:hypothetical protein